MAKMQCNFSQFLAKIHMYLIQILAKNQENRDDLFPLRHQNDSGVEEKHYWITVEQVTEVESAPPPEMVAVD